MTAAASVEKRVDTLRRAAARIRVRALPMLPGAPWEDRKGSVWRGRHCAPNTVPMGSRMGMLMSAHVASWDPTVALAVADMLEEFARLDDQGIHPPTAVVTLAKRYLGEAS